MAVGLIAPKAIFSASSLESSAFMKGHTSCSAFSLGATLALTLAAEAWPEACLVKVVNCAHASASALSAASFWASLFFLAFFLRSWRRGSGEGEG